MPLGLSHCNNTQNTILCESEFLGGKLFNKLFDLNVKKRVWRFLIVFT